MANYKMIISYRAIKKKRSKYMNTFAKIEFFGPFIRLKKLEGNFSLNSNLMNVVYLMLNC